MNIGDMFVAVATKVDGGKYERNKRAVDQDVLNDFLSRNSELFAAFNESRQQVSQKLVAFSRINVVTDEPGVPSAKRAGDIADSALLTLIDRGVLTFAIETAESKAALEDLKQRVERAGLRPPTTLPPQIATAEAEPVVNPVDQCAADYIRHPNNLFKAKWLTKENRTIYDTACQQGGAIDQAIAAAQHQEVGSAGRYRGVRA